MNGLRTCASWLSLAVALAVPGALHATDYRVPSGTSDPTPKTLTGVDTLTVDPNALLTSPTDPTINQAGQADNVIVTNNGRIEAPAGRAFNTTGTGTIRNITINNGTNAVIVAGDDALRVGSAIGTGTITVNNVGTIVSLTAQAIDFDSIPAATGTLTINNFAGGVIQSAADDAIRPAFGTINNAGTIVSDGVAGSTSDAIDSGFRIATINNFDGGLISGYRNGISASNSVNVANSGAGTIAGRNGSGISASGVATINNLGGIVGAVNGVTAGGFNIQNSAGGAILGNGGNGLATTGNGQLLNAGSIGGAINGVAAGGSLTIENTTGGAIIGSSGAGVIAVGNGTILNSGIISGGAAAGSVNVDGDGIRIGNFATITNNGVIQGTGSVGVNANGVANASDGINMTSGTVTNNAGALIVGADNGIVVDDGAGGPGIRATTITNAGTIRGIAGTGIRLTGAFNDTVNNSGTIIGAGTAISLGAGDDRLSLITSSVIQGTIDGGDGTDTVLLGGVAGTVGTLGPTVNFEALNVQATTWILTGNSTYANGILVFNGGRLDNRGTLLGATTVNNGEIVNGGTYGSLSLTNRSAIRPGDSNAIGTITVSGDYLQTGQSVYFADINAAGAADRIVVGGAAKLEGGAVLAFTRAPGTYTPGTRYVLLTATGGLAGTFGTVAADPDPLTFLRVNYSVNAVTVDVLRNPAGIATGAVTPNQAAVATAFNGVDINNPLFTAVGSIVSTSQLTAVLDALSGEAYASARAGLAQDARRVTAAIATRFENATPRSGGWMQGIVASGRADGAKGAAGLKQQAYGAVGGVDVFTVDRMRGGVALGYTHDKTDVDARGSSTNSDAFQVALYGGGSFGRVNFRLVAGYSWVKLKTVRNVALPSAETVRSSYDGSSQFGLGEISYALPFGNFTVSPFAAAQVSHVNTDTATETGGISALTIASGGEDISAATAGVRVVGPEAGPIALRGSLGFRRIIGTDRPRITATFTGTNGIFNVFGASLPRYAGVGDIDLIYRLGDRARIGVGYSGVIGSGGSDHAARVTVAIGL